MYDPIDATARPDSPRDEPDDTPERARDERELYGQPCHEVGGGCDEQTLYGDPQHETAESPEIPDLEFLLVRMRGSSAVETSPTSATASPADATAPDAFSPIEASDR